MGDLLRDAPVGSSLQGSFALGGADEQNDAEVVAAAPLPGRVQRAVAIAAHVQALGAREVAQG